MKKDCEFGFVEYRKPNMIEGLEFMGKMGLNSSKLQDGNELMQNDLYYTAQAMKHMEPFLTKIQLEKDGVEFNDYTKSIEGPEFIGVFMEVAGDIMSFMQVDAKKKKRSKT